MMNEKIFLDLKMLKREWSLCLLLLICLLPINFLKSGISVDGFLGFIFSLFIVIAGVLDFKYLRLFNRVVYPMLISGIVIGGINAVLWGSILGGGMFCLKLLKPDGLGMGDVKYSAAIGSWLGSEAVFMVMPIAFFLGLLYALFYMIYIGKFNKNLCIPFGPCLSAAGFIVFIWGEQLWP